MEKKKSPLIKATSFKSKEHVELRQPSIYPLSIKERTHTPLSIYLAKCSINIKLISPLRVSITQTFFSQVISLVIVLVYGGKSRQDGSKRGGRAACFLKPALHPSLLINTLTPLQSIMGWLWKLWHVPHFQILDVQSCQESLYRLRRLPHTRLLYKAGAAWQCCQMTASQPMTSIKARPEAFSLALFHIIKQMGGHTNTDYNSSAHFTTQLLESCIEIKDQVRWAQCWRKYKLLMQAKRTNR